MKIGACLLPFIVLCLSFAPIEVAQNQNKPSVKSGHHQGGGGGGGHHSAEHVAAVKKCSDDYKAAFKEAKSKRGKEREDATRQAKEERKQCIAGAPM